MKKLLLLTVMAMASACGGGADDLLDKMGSYKNQMCKCTDAACADKVEKDMRDWMMANKDKFKDIKPTKEQDEKADKIQDEMRACEKKARGEGTAPAPATP